MSLNFGQTGYPAFSETDEDGQCVPCALGQAWVNEDTQKTLAKLRIPRTDPWGKPLLGEPDDPKVGAQKS
jgi:hypothetical protein